MRRKTIAEYLQEKVQKRLERTLEFLEEEFKYVGKLGDGKELFQVHNRIRIMSGNLNDIIITLTEEK